MKKNAMLKIAAVLLVAVLLTTCAISSTFAKYTTKFADYHDEAKVARWGINVTTNTPVAQDLFKNNYDDTVVGDDGADVIAPGTEGQYTIKITINGRPEVDALVSFVDGKDSTNTDYVDCNCSQVKWSYALNGSSTFTSVDNVSDLNNAINGALNGFKFEAGDAEFTKTIDITIKWKWDFEDAPVTDANDQTDTGFGNNAANYYATVTVYGVITQID